MRRRRHRDRDVPEAGDERLPVSARRKLDRADALEAEVARVRAESEPGAFEVFERTRPQVEEAMRLRMSVAAKLRAKAGALPSHLEELRWARRARQRAGRDAA